MLGEMKKIVVIGGGITGITSAYYLQKEARKRGLPLSISLIEAAPRLGGKIQTVQRDGFFIERGPDSFFENNESAIRLTEELGLADQLLPSNVETAYVLANDRLHPMPAGLVRGIPTQITSFMKTSLVSIPGKVRAGTDLLLPKPKPGQDQSVGRFFKRHFGAEVVENLIEPLVSGMYGGDINKLSLVSTFPRAYEAEQKHRSLMLGMRKIPYEQGASMTVQGGLEGIVEEAAASLTPGSVLKGTRVEKVERREDGIFTLVLNSGKHIVADSIISTVPHFMLPAMMPQYKFFHDLKEIPSASVASISLAFSEDVIPPELQGTGFVVARNSDFTMTMCTWVHRKWPDAVPKGKALLRCYIGRAGDEAVVDLPDSELERIVLTDLKRIIPLNIAPSFSVVTRWKKAIPQYIIGHQQRLEEMEKHLQKELPGFFVAGSSFKGLSLPDCISQGEEAAEKAWLFCGYDRFRASKEK
ncbi:Protoporphyrinogen IX oxidase, aerobic, HemY [Bacillus thermotolerans]|uniref:Coproporphyrinogen III oxidase n=2 Tax=Bacillus thermotolerans TaxID=1221996 RepID=A0A0F5I413_BACTR|nr:Protoporphyrinogen IX oxidase, aerobic, HemY [Bacillus thermotolerans]